MHSARHLMLIDICIKFHEYSLSVFFSSYRADTIFCDAQSSKGNKSKSIKGRVTILALCMSSHADIYLYEVSYMELKPFSSYRADMI